MTNLTIELVPQTCFYNNLRKHLTKKQWDCIRKKVYKIAGDRCEICNGVGPKWPVECHEIWAYDDDTHIVSLSGFLALCPKCHKVKHLGMAEKIGLLQESLRHFMNINDIDFHTCQTMQADAMQTWTHRSNFEWITNIEELQNWLSMEDYFQAKLKFERRTFQRV